MESLERSDKWYKIWNFWKVKWLILALWLALWASNFSYSQNVQNNDKQEQTNDIERKSLEKYKSKIQERDENIISYTTETLDEFADRVIKCMNFDGKQDSINTKLNNLADILNHKYNTNISNNSAYIILKNTILILTKNKKYEWLCEYTPNNNLAFINGFWYIQYINTNTDYINYRLSGQLLDTLIQDLWDTMLTNNKPDTYNIENTETWEQNQNMDNLEKQKNPTNIESNSEDDFDINANVNLLSQHLSSNKLNWVTYEDVWNTIEWFRHEWLKNAVMNCLLHNDVIWAQRLLWMDINCDKSKYPNYVASTRIWKRELDLMEKYSETRRYMDSQEILNFMERVEKAYEIENYEVKTTYLKFLSWEFDNWWLPYCIISKYDYKIYLFTSDHKLVACQPVLTGAHIWNEKNDPIHWSHSTPGGMYVMWWTFDKSSEWKNLLSVYWTDYLLFLPQEGQYYYSEEYSMGMHGHVKWREWRFESQNAKDHRVSNWCINIYRPMFWEIINHLKIWSKIYICRDDEI